MVLSPSGVRLSLLVGPTVPIPAPPDLALALEHVEVTHTDRGRSGFQVTFQAGRAGPFGLMDYPLLSSPLLKPFNRVVLVVTLNSRPHVLMDGIITHQQPSPSSEPGASRLTITGEDVSVMMDQEEKSIEHPAQADLVIATKIIVSYAKFGLIPLVIPPVFFDQPLPTERTPVQQGTDLDYLNTLAERHAYVFYVKPGPVPLTNTAYWGPPIRVGVPQPALSVNLGAETNVESISFQHDALSPTMVSGKVQDRTTNQSIPVRTFGSLRVPLASLPTAVLHMGDVRRTQFRQSGLSAAQAFARAQAITDRSVDEVVSGTGELDAVRYGGLLHPRELVGVRGAGFSYDGFYYVKSVTHSIRVGEYSQRFTITREGVGSTTPVVRV